MKSHHVISVYNEAFLNDSCFRINRLRRRWRWWNMLVVFLGLLSIVEFVYSWHSVLSSKFSDEPVNFEIRNYVKSPYQPLDKSAQITLPTDATVFHVTKEFGIASTTDMGRVLTALAHTQLQTKRVKPSIVLPHYTFLNKQQQYPIKKTVDLVITAHDEKGNLVNVNFRVSQFKYDFEPNKNFNKLGEEEKFLYTSMIHKRPSVMVYLIGFGKRDPFRKVFKARTPEDMYSQNDLKDQYFAKAAAAFLIWKATGKHEQSLFAPLHSQVRLDVVHLHGASSAYVAKYLREADEHMGPSSPSIIYTMHDDQDLQYANTLEVIETFTTAKSAKHFELELQQLNPYTFNSRRVFMAPLGIDMSDAVIVTNEGMARDLIERGMDLYLKETIMPNLLKKAEESQFYGISNGLYFPMDPFANKQLVQANLAYPEYVKAKIFGWKTNVTLETIDRVTDVKQRAKEYLVSLGLLSNEDLDRPLVLCEGQDFSREGQLYNMKFVTDVEKDYLVYFRAAADYTIGIPQVNLFGALQIDTLSLAQAAQEYYRLKSAPELHEDHVLRLIASAYALGWIRPGEDQGPAYDYLRVYEQAIQEKRKTSKFKLPIL